jgi:hypothetical protein
MTRLAEISLCEQFLFCFADENWQNKMMSGKQLAV